MASTVEIIIKGVDQSTDASNKAKKNIEGVGNAATKANASAHRQFEQLGKAVLKAGLGIVAAIKFLQEFGKKAEELGFVKAAQQVRDMNQAFDDSEAALLKFNIGGKEVQEWLGQAAEAGGQLIRILGILASEGAGEVEKAFNMARATVSQFNSLIGIAEVEFLKFTGIISEQAAQTKIAEIATNTYTTAQAEADNAIVDATTHTNALNFATIGLAKTLENTGRQLKGIAQTEGKSLNTLRSKITLNKQLNDTLKQQLSINDAIRAGDARALAEAQNGGGGGRGGVTRGTTNHIRGSLGGASTAGNNGATVVHVYVGNQALNSHIRTQTVKTLTDAAKFPGKDQ